MLVLFVLLFFLFLLVLAHCSRLRERSVQRKQSSRPNALNSDSNRLWLQLARVEYQNNQSNSKRASKFEKHVYQTAKWRNPT